MVNDSYRDGGQTPCAVDSEKPGVEMKSRMRAAILAVALGLLTAYLPLETEAGQFLGLPGLLIAWLFSGGPHSSGMTWLFFFVVGQGIFYIGFWYLAILLVAYLLRRNREKAKTNVV